MSTWMNLLVSTSDALRRQGALNKEEETNRRSLVVEERSALAHIVRKLRSALKGKAMPDSDDSADEGDPRAPPTSSLLLKYKLVAERRQVEWSLYEARCRALRREYDASHDPSVLDAIDALPKPVKHKKPPPPPVATTAQRPTTAGAADGTTGLPTTVSLVSRPHSAATQQRIALLNPPAVLQLPPEVQTAMQAEGFARATVIMEERANRNALANTWRISLIEGDDEMRARTWDRECYTKELDARERLRAGDASAQRAKGQEDIANRHRIIAKEQTNRVFLKKMLRERRVALQYDEVQIREDIATEWQKWFNISIVLMNFRSILRIVPLEETMRRASVEGSEWMERQRFAIRLWKHYQWADGLLAEGADALFQLFDTETFLMRTHVEMYEKTLKEQEEEMRRRDAIRAVQEAEELERLKLEAKYGASPLTTRPASAGNRLVLRPADEFEIIRALHPPSGITEAVKKTFRSNQENNALFMALEKKYIKVKKGIDDAETPDAIPNPTTTSAHPDRASCVAAPPPQAYAPTQQRQAVGVAVVSPKEHNITSFEPLAPASTLNPALVA